MSEWCTCKTELFSGHLSLEPVADVWVHGECLKPSFTIWQSYEDYCFECGRSFSSPVSDVCQDCDPLAQSWFSLSSLYLQFVADRDAEYFRRNPKVSAVRPCVEFPSVV